MKSREHEFGCQYTSPFLVEIESSRVLLTSSCQSELKAKQLTTESAGSNNRSTSPNSCGGNQPKILVLGSFRLTWDTAQEGGCNFREWGKSGQGLNKAITLLLSQILLAVEIRAAGTTSQDLAWAQGLAVRLIPAWEGANKGGSQRRRWARVGNWAITGT